MKTIGYFLRIKKQFTYDGKMEICFEGSSLSEELAIKTIQEFTRSNVRVYIECSAMIEEEIKQ